MQSPILMLAALFLGALAALAEPPPGDPRWAQAAKAYGEGFSDEGHRLLKALIADHPGDLDLAAACYEKIFAQEYRILPKHVPFKPLGQPMQSHWHATNHYTGVNTNTQIPPAVERILALERLGALSAHTAFLRTVGGACLEGYLNRLTFLELGEMLTRLRSENPRDPFWRLMEAYALSIMKRPEAGKLLNALRRDIDLDHSDDGLRSDWMVADALLSQGMEQPVMAKPAVPEGSPLPVLAPVNPDDPEDPWRKVLDRSPKDVAVEVDRLIALAATSKEFMMWVNTDGGGLHPTRALDLHLFTKPSAELEALRKLQETLASPEAQAAARTEAGILKLTRRYPWARSAQVLLLKIANEALWNARFESAWRSFHEVLLHTSDPGLREAAQVGVWTAQALSGGAAEVLAQPTAFEPAKTYPWMGRPTKGAEIRAALQAMIPPGPTVAAPALKDLRPHVVHLPPVSPWVINAYTGGDYSIDLQVSGKTLLATGRNLIAAYDAAQPGTPLWTHAQQFPSEKNHRAPFPGYFRGLIKDGAIVTRWGMNELPNGLAALNLATGDPLWTSLNAVANGFSGENLNQASPIPLGDPVHADGKLFYLQTTVTNGRADGRPVFSLVCFDPATAQPSWATPIIDSRVDLGNLQPNYSFTYGNAVTVHRGAVYSCSNVGHIARSDVRDGRVEWAHKYAYRGGDNGGSVGSTPIIAGSNVIFLPRNTERLIALDQRTGALAWENPMIRVFEVLGLWQDTLVVRGPSHFAGLDVATGNARWIRNLTQRAFNRGQLIADSVYLGQLDALQRFDARTGELLESRPWALQPERALSFTISGQDLHIASDQPRADLRQKVGQPPGPEVASSAQPLKLPLKPAWSLMRPGASLLLPPAGVNPGTAILLGDGMLECLEVNERGGIRWRRFLDLKINQLVIRYIGKKGEILMLMEQGESPENPPRALALDTKTGATLWETTVPLWRDPPPSFCGSLMIFASHAHKLGGGATAIDLTTGKQLWRRYLRSSSPPVAKGDESRLLLLGNLWTPKPARVTLNAQTGQTIADSPEKSALLPMLYTVHGNKAPGVYLIPPVGDPTVFQPQAVIVDQIPGTGAPYYLIRPRDGTDKTPEGVYRADDPSYFCRLPSADVLFDGDYAITIHGRFAVTDLKAKRLLPLPATDEKAAINQPGFLCRIGPDRLLKLVDHGSAKNVVFIIDLASGAVTEGKLELPSQDGPINLSNYTNLTPPNRPFLPTFDRVFLTYDNTTVTAWVAAP
jgi:outer membrane protein assembly factor BamB